MSGYSIFMDVLDVSIHYKLVFYMYIRSKVLVFDIVMDIFVQNKLNLSVCIEIYKNQSEFEGFNVRSFDDSVDSSEWKG